MPYTVDAILNMNGHDQHCTNYMKLENKIGLVPKITETSKLHLEFFHSVSFRWFPLATKYTTDAPKEGWFTLLASILHFRPADKVKPVKYFVQWKRCIPLVHSCECGKMAVNVLICPSEWPMTVHESDHVLHQGREPHSTANKERRGPGQNVRGSFLGAFVGGGASICLVVPFVFCSCARHDFRRLGFVTA